MFCSRCGNALIPDARFCGCCGQALAADGAAAPVDEATALYAACLGPANTAWYLQRFRRFEETGKAGVGWHWPAALINFYWFLYRKLWLEAAVYFAAPYVLLLVLGVLVLATGQAPAAVAVAVILYLVFSVAALVLPGLFATALLYRRCRRRIGKARQLHATHEARVAFLASEGGTSNAALGVVVALLAVMWLGIMAAIAIPAWQDYTVRSRVAAAHAAGLRAAEAVGRHHAAQGRWPQTLADTGYAAPLPEDLAGIEIEGEQGVLVLTFDRPPLVGLSFMLIPTQQDGRLHWACVNRDLPERQLPSACREDAGVVADEEQPMESVTL
jgi:hypothetical protein